MDDSTLREARTALQKAQARLHLEDIDEQDVDKIISHIEDAKNQLE